MILNLVCGILLQLACETSFLELLFPVAFSYLVYLTFIEMTVV